MTVTIRRACKADAPFLPEVEHSAAASFRTLPDLAWLADDAVMSAEAHERAIDRGVVWLATSEASGIVGFLVAEPVGAELHI